MVLCQLSEADRRHQEHLQHAIKDGSTGYDALVAATGDCQTQEAGFESPRDVFRGPQQ